MNDNNQLNDVSVCIITKDEENMLQDCLESVRKCSSEIIVVDTGSTDKTVQIAEKFGCKVFFYEWNNDFSKARNFALSKATKPYILSIDADERLLNPEQINEVITSKAKDTGGWLIEVSSQATRINGTFDLYYSNLLRMFVNHPNVKFQGIIHEQVIETLLENGFKIENTHLQFLHLGYQHSSDSMNKKHKRNLDLLNIAITENPTDSHLLYHRAKTYLALNDLIQAEKNIHETLYYVKKDSSIYPQSLNYGAVIAFQSSKYDIALSRAIESLKVIPNQAFANFILGETYSVLNQFDSALNSYYKMRQAQETPDVIARIVGDYNLPPEQLSFRLGRSLVGLKRYDEAYIEFKKGNELNPTEISCIVGIANIEYFRQNYIESKKLLESALSIDMNRQDVLAYLRTVENEMITKNIKVNEKTSRYKGPKINEKPLISLSMIVKNEEKYLSGCLDSIIDAVDEIIIVDTGSNDRTKEIALSYGAKIFDYKWKNDFAEARNESLKHCTGEWILYLDADERMEAASASKLRYLLENTKFTDGYVCTIESEHFQLDGDNEQHRGGYPRIFRNFGYPAIKFEGRVHEQITPSIFALGKSISFSDIVINHLGYNQNREVMEAKVKRNYQLLIEHINEEPLNAYAWYQLGQTLAQMKLTDQAESAVKFAIELGKLSDSVYASAASTLSHLSGNKGNYIEALQWADKSLEKAPDQVYALHLKAYALLYLNKLDDSEHVFYEVLKRIKNKKGVPQSGFDISLSEEVVYKGLNEINKKKALKNN